MGPSANSAVNLGDVYFEQYRGRWQGLVLAIALPDSPKHRDGPVQKIKLDLTQEAYSRMASTGVPVRLRLKMADAKGKPLSQQIRLVIVDSSTGNTGSVRIPVTILQPKAK